MFEIRRRHYKEALTLAEKAVTLAPNSADALRILGIILTFIDKPEEAIPFIKQAIRLTPLRGNFELGFAYMAMGNYEKAIASAQKSLADNPQFLQPHMVAAVSYAHLGHEDEAKKAFNEYLKTYPDEDYPDMQFIYFMYCFKNPDVFARFIEGLVKAGYKKDSRGYYPVDEANKLNGREIRNLLFGKTVNLSINGVEYIVVRSKEGELKINIPSYMVSIKGKSWIKGDMLCNQYENLREGIQSCNDIYYNPGGNAIENSQYLSLTDALLIPFSVED